MNITERHWEDYIGSKGVFKRDTALFPTLDADLPDRNLLLAERFRWLASTYDDYTDMLFERWKHARDYLIEERVNNAELTLEQFHRYSVNLPLVMAQVETEEHNLNYYRHLRDVLRLLPARKDHPVLVLGPTFGSELEAIDTAGAMPHLLSTPAPWLDICEERLFHCRTRFECVTDESLLQNPVNFRYTVISTWAPDPVMAILTAYNALGESGFVLFPASNASLTDISDRAGLWRVDSRQPSAAVYFKHPGLEVSLDHVHLEA